MSEFVNDRIIVVLEPTQFINDRIIVVLEPIQFMMVLPKLRFGPRNFVIQEVYFL